MPHARWAQCEEESMTQQNVPGVVYTPGEYAIPQERLESGFKDKKPLMTESQALLESGRCLYCHDAPCIKSCPTAIDIPSFIRKINTQNTSGSARVILDSNILGLSCASVCPTEVLCEGTCVYNEMDEPPIQIGRLQRYATEHAYAKDLRFFARGEDSGKTVALVGGGPASLACAHELSMAGHRCVIFEGRKVPGGLNTTGVAPYKLRLEDSIREVDYVLGIGGIEMRTGVKVGEDVTFEQLVNDYDAVFLGAGLGPDGFLGLDGEDKSNVVGAVELIERMKTEAGFKLDGVDNALVIGGGNTAIDVVRELRGVGVENVTMVYRRDEKAMSGYIHEWDGAKKEGVRSKFWTQPAAYVIDGDKVTALRCHPTHLVDASAGRGKLKINTEESFDIPADLIVLAVGQGKLESELSAIGGIEFDWGKVKVGDNGQTGNPKVFAGGDCVNGGKEVVNASAEGKVAARGIDAFLRGN